MNWQTNLNSGAIFDHLKSLSSNLLPSTTLIYKFNGFTRHRAGHNWSAETEITPSYKLGEYYKYKADCLNNVLHCYSIHFKLCHFCFESATLSKSYCIGITFLKLLFYRFIIIIREIVRRIECLGAIELRLMQRIMNFVKVNSFSVYLFLHTILHCF